MGAMAPAARCVGEAARAVRRTVARSGIGWAERADFRSIAYSKPTIAVGAVGSQICGGKLDWL